MPRHASRLARLRARTIAAADPTEREYRAASARLNAHTSALAARMVGDRLTDEELDALNDTMALAAATATVRARMNVEGLTDEEARDDLRRAFAEMFDDPYP